jgi:hypothetical protein
MRRPSGRSFFRLFPFFVLQASPCQTGFVLNNAISIIISILIILVIVAFVVAFIQAFNAKGRTSENQFNALDDMVSGLIQVHGAANRTLSFPFDHDKQEFQGTIFAVSSDGSLSSPFPPTRWYPGALQDGQLVPVVLSQHMSQTLVDLYRDLQDPQRRAQLSASEIRNIAQLFSLLSTQCNGALQYAENHYKQQNGASTAHTSSKTYPPCFCFSAVPLKPLKDPAERLQLVRSVLEGTTTCHQFSLPYGVSTIGLTFSPMLPEALVAKSAVTSPPSMLLTKKGGTCSDPDPTSTSAMCVTLALVSGS